MSTDDLTRSVPPADPDATRTARDPSEAALDAGLAAAFGGDLTPRPSDADLEAGTVIAGRYTLTEKVGEGGMGSVWVAQQTEPVKRTVAIKLIKAGMDSKQVLARFDAERQALAVMDHPNIAKVLDGGVWSPSPSRGEGLGVRGNVPYFVMELVKGVPITTFCDERKLTPAQRLELFVPVCAAIQHAHQKGVIHRDIKPSNVLVALYDDKPVPKVIDFGIAKATEAALTDHTLETAFGAVVGTPAYMSPEQAGLNTLDIDTRSDVYALGVLLYELLTGSPPFTHKELMKKGMLEMLRVVREVEPPRPSDKLSTADTLPSLSAVRGTEPKALTGLLRNELDWIVMKALEKDRGRRYDTANGFAADVQRYLSGEPVHAHPPSAGYRLAKFVRRNKVQVVAASVVLLALVAGVVGTTFGLLRAEEKRREADGARQDEARERQRAEANERSARDRLGQVERGSQVLFGIFEELDVGRVKAAGEPVEASLAAQLVRAGRQLDENAVGDPLVVAKLQNQLGRALTGLGHPADAVPLLEASHATRARLSGPDDTDTAASANHLATAYLGVGRTKEAIDLYERSLGVLKATHGPVHPTVLQAVSNLSQGYSNAGRRANVIELLEPYDAYRRAQPLTMSLPNSPMPALLNNLASAYLGDGKTEKALELWEACRTALTERAGADHPTTLTVVNNLAQCYGRLGQRAEALRLGVEAMDGRAKRLGADHPATLGSKQNVAVMHFTAGDFDRAAALLEEVVRARKRVLPADHPDTLTALNSLALAHFAGGKWHPARDAFREFVDGRRAVKRTQDADYFNALAGLGGLLVNDAAFADAEPLLRDALRFREEKMKGTWQLYATRSALGGALLGQKKYADAEPLLLSGYEGVAEREALIPAVGKVRLPEALDRLVELYTATGKPDEVTKYKALRAKYPAAKPPEPKK